MLLNFGDRTRTGVFNMIWPLARETPRFPSFYCDPPHFSANGHVKNLEIGHWRRVNFFRTHWFFHHPIANFCGGGTQNPSHRSIFVSPPKKKPVNFPATSKHCMRKFEKSENFRISIDLGAWVNADKPPAKEAKVNANSTQCSQAVTHPSTNQAQCCLTSVIGRELVRSTWYGRWQGLLENCRLKSEKWWCQTVCN